MKALTVAATAIALAVGSSVGWAASPKKVTVALGGDGLQISAVHIANGAGFFREEGLEIEFVDVNSGTRQTAAIMGGSALFAPLGMIHTIKINAKGGNLKAASAMTNVLDIHIILSKAALEKTGITRQMPIDERVRRMQGLRLGITSPGSTTDTTVRSLFKARGHDPDSYVKLVPLGGGSNMLAAFEQGQVDGFCWSAPQPHVAEARGLGTIVIDPFDKEAPEVVDLPYQVMVVNGATAEANRDVIERSIRAMAKGYNFARANPEKALAILQARFPQFDKAILAKVWPNYIKGLPMTPVISQEQFDRTQNWLNITSPTKFDLKFDQVIDNVTATAVAKQLSK